MWRKVTAWKGVWCNVKDFFECGALFMSAIMGNCLLMQPPLTENKASTCYNPLATIIALHVWM
jgi:hypothetical protein